MSDGLKLPTRMEQRLGLEIGNARSALEADCKRAELAAYRARLGHLDDAGATLSALRQKNERQPQIALSAWIHLAQGIAAYFGDGGVSRTDGVQRAHALCLAGGLHELRAVCAAWLAQWDYSRSDMVALAGHVHEVLQMAAPQNHAARSRANLVGAQALHLAARPDLARPWYLRAREHAVADGDEATLNALLHNMAWLRMLAMRQVVLTGEGDASAGRHALMSAESNAHFGEMVGDSSWPELEPLLRAQIASLQGEAAAALGLYGEHLAGATKSSRLQANLLADKAWCHVQLSQLDEARHCADVAVQSLTPETHVDDRAAAHSRLSQTFSVLGDEPSSAQHTALANGAWAAHALVQADAIKGLAR